MGGVVFDVAPVLDGIDTTGVSPYLLSGVLRDIAEAVLAYIVSGWPVLTGRSIAGWHVQGGPPWLVVNRVEYVEWVRDGLAFVLFDSAMSRAPALARSMLAERLARQAAPPGTRPVVPLQPRRGPGAPAPRTPGPARPGVPVSAPPGPLPPGPGPHLATGLRALLRPATATALAPAVQVRLDALIAVWIRSGQVAPGVISLLRRGLIPQAAQQLEAAGLAAEAEKLRKITRRARPGR